MRRPRVPVDPALRMRAEANRAADEHRRLKEWAANVIADQKLAELNLRRELQRYDDLVDRMRHVVQAAGNTPGPADDEGSDRRRAATEALAVELVAAERDIDDLDARWGRATAAADEAKARVRAHTRHLHRLLAEGQGGPAGAAAASGDGEASPAAGWEAAPGPVRFGAGGEIRRAELRALLGLRTAGRHDGPGRTAARAAGPDAGAVVPPAYPVGSQPPRPDGPPRRR